MRIESILLTTVMVRTFAGNRPLTNATGFFRLWPSPYFATLKANSRCHHKPAARAVNDVSAHRTTPFDAGHASAKGSFEKERPAAQGRQHSAAKGRFREGKLQRPLSGDELEEMSVAP